MKLWMFTFGTLSRCSAPANCLTLFHCYGSIQLLRSDMALGFNGGYAGVPVCFVQSPVPSTCVLTGGNTAFPDERCEQHERVLGLRTPQREQVVKNLPLSSTETVWHSDVMTLIVTTSVMVVMTMRMVTRIVTRDACRPFKVMCTYVPLLYSYLKVCTCMSYLSPLIVTLLHPLIFHMSLSSFL